MVPFYLLLFHSVKYPSSALTPTLPSSTPLPHSPPMSSPRLGLLYGSTRMSEMVALCWTASPPPLSLQLWDGETEQITITQITTNIQLHWQQKQTWEKIILDLLKWSSKKVLKQKKLKTFLSFSLLSGELPLIWIPQKSAVSFQTGSRTVVFFRLSCLFELAFLFSDSSW